MNILHISIFVFLFFIVIMILFRFYTATEIFEDMLDTIKRWFRKKDRKKR